MARVKDPIRYSKLRPRKHKFPVSEDARRLERAVFANPLEDAPALMLRDELIQAGYSRRSAIYQLMALRRVARRRMVAEVLAAYGRESNAARVLLARNVELPPDYEIYVLVSGTANPARQPKEWGPRLGDRNGTPVIYVPSEWFFAEVRSLRKLGMLRADELTRFG